MERRLAVRLWVSRIIKTLSILRIVVKGVDERLIWYFLAGFIAGWVGMMMFAGWYIRRHTTVVRMTKEDVERFKDEDRHTDDDVPGD